LITVEGCLTNLQFLLELTSEVQVPAKQVQMLVWGDLGT
jgi:hypothetical protein